MQFPKVGRGRPERFQGSGLKSGVTVQVAISVCTPTPERPRVHGAGSTYFWELHPRAETSMAELVREYSDFYGDEARILPLRRFVKISECAAGTDIFMAQEL